MKSSCSKQKLVFDLSPKLNKIPLHFAFFLLPPPFSEFTTNCPERFTNMIQAKRPQEDNLGETSMCKKTKEEEKRDSKIQKWVQSLDLKLSELQKQLVCENLACLCIRFKLEFDGIKNTATHFFKYEPKCNREAILLNCNVRNTMEALRDVASKLIKDNQSSLSGTKPAYTGDEKEVYPWALMGLDADYQILKLIDIWSKEEKVDRHNFAQLWFGYVVEFDDVEPNFEFKTVQEFKDSYIPDEYPCYPTDKEIEEFLAYMRIPDQLPVPLVGGMVCPVCKKDLCYEFKVAEAVQCAGCFDAFTGHYQRFWLQQPLLFQTNRIEFLAQFECMRSECCNPSTFSLLTGCGTGVIRPLNYCSEECFQEDEEPKFSQSWILGLRSKSIHHTN